MRGRTAAERRREAAEHVLERVDDHYVGRFRAMGGPCEVLADTDDPSIAATALAIAREEARRIERKFSRYRDEGVVHRLHAAGGAPVEVDGETALLLDYASTCHELSGGRFDITSGVLRRAWTFDGSCRVPDDATVRALLAHVGWTRVTWRRPVFVLPAGMEVDFGGVGKEYAVDRAAALVAADVGCAFVVNFGGDLVARGPRRGGRPWVVGVDDPARTGEAAIARVEIDHGALATSGDARRFVMHRGKRLGHILDPRTGWPVEDAPRAVTVVAGTCLEAGSLSTLAVLHGAEAGVFLREQGVRHWIA